jgi:hypothetical protein
MGKQKTFIASDTLRNAVRDRKGIEGEPFGDATLETTLNSEIATLDGKKIGTVPFRQYLTLVDLIRDIRYLKKQVHLPNPNIRIDFIGSRVWNIKIDLLRPFAVALATAVDYSFPPGKAPLGTVERAKSLVGALPAHNGQKLNTLLVELLPAWDGLVLLRAHAAHKYQLDDASVTTRRYWDQVAAPETEEEANQIALSLREREKKEKEKEKTSASEEERKVRHRIIEEQRQELLALRERATELHKGPPADQYLLNDKEILLVEKVLAPLRAMLDLLEEFALQRIKELGLSADPNFK